MVLTYVFLVSNNVAYFFLCFLDIKSPFERSLLKSFLNPLNLFKSPAPFLRREVVCAFIIFAELLLLFSR